MAAKRLEILKETVPGMRRVGVLYPPQRQNQWRVLEGIRAAGDRLKVQVEAIEIRSPEEIKSVLRGSRAPVSMACLLAHRRCLRRTRAT